MVRRPVGSVDARRLAASGPAAWRAAAYKPLYVLLADHLEARIAAGQFPDGAYLPGIRDLMGQFGVSLATVRGALRILRSKGLVAARRGSGIRVTCPGPAAERAAEPMDVPKDVRDLFEARLILEPAALESAWSRLDADGLAALYARTRRTSRADIFVVDERLHEEILTKCVNPYLRRALAEVMGQIHLYREINFRRFYTGQSSHDYQTVGRIIRAIRADDRARATAALRIHVTYTRDRLLQFISGRDREVE